MAHHPQIAPLLRAKVPLSWINQIPWYLVKVRVESNDLKWINAILFLTRFNTFPTFFLSSPYSMKYDEDAPPCCSLVILVFCNVALFDSPHDC